MTKTEYVLDSLADDEEEKTYYSYDGSGNLRFERRGRTETENSEPLFGVVVSKNTERNNTQTA